MNFLKKIQTYKLNLPSIWIWSSHGSRTSHCPTSMASRRRVRLSSVIHRIATTGIRVTTTSIWVPTITSITLQRKNDIIIFSPIYMCRYKFEFQYSHNRPYDLSCKKVVEEEDRDLDYIHLQVRDRKEADRALGHHARLKYISKTNILL